MEYYLFDSPTPDAESSFVTDEASHVTGSKNTGKVGGMVSIATWQWLIVIGALATLWALRFGLKSAIIGK